MSRAQAIESAPVAQLPVVAIVGRPNAGKSTLFNRLVRAPRALVDATPGVTRDRNVALAQWGERRFQLVDTGGVDEDHRDADSLAPAIRAQALLATAEADAIILLFDGRAGCSPLERALLQRLRQAGTPLFCAVNKLDTARLDEDASDFFRLGVDTVYPISAAHGRGIDALMDDVLAALPAPSTEMSGAAAESVALAIVGRPNVGKSSLLNRLVGEERMIVSEQPGTTRDAIDSPAIINGKPYRLIDTAGVRRRPKVHEEIERASVSRALRALDRAEIALLVLDATSGLAEQDARIAGHAWERGCALLIVVNKWDAMAPRERNESILRQALADRYPTLGDVPMVFVSAKTGLGVDGIIPAVETLVATHRAHWQTARVNHVLAAAVQAQAPPTMRGNKRPVFYYATQTGTAPPTLTVFTNGPALVHPAYSRFLHNQFCAAFGLRGTPLRLHFRARPRDEQRQRPATSSRHKKPVRPRGPRRGR